MPSSVVLSVAAVVGVHLTSATDLSQGEAVQMTQILASSIAKQTGREVVVDDPLWSGCLPNDPCVQNVRARTRSTDVVLVQLIAGVTLVRIEVTRDGGVMVEADVARDDLGPACERLAKELFPEGRVEPPSGVALVAPEPIAPSTSVLPWVTLGGTVVALAVGVAFGASSSSARTQSQSPDLTRDEFEGLADRTQRHAVIADVSFVIAAAAGVVTGVLWAVE